MAVALQVERWGSWFPAATRLHAGLGQLIKPGTRGGLLGMGVFLGLVELFLHSSAGVPIRQVFQWCVCVDSIATTRGRNRLGGTLT